MPSKYQPFAAEDVVNLLAYQQGQNVHPFTCANRGDGHHGKLWGDTGTLVPTVHGWICLWCSYTQDWAHAAMCDGTALKAAESVFTALKKRTADDQEA